MRIAKMMTAVCIAAGVGGCASVVRGTTNQVQIVSEPAGADVRTSMGMTCITPCTLTVGRKDEFIVTYSKPGFQSVDVPVKTRIAGDGVATSAGNILIGGIIGVGVDAATGATLEHVPNPVSATLEPIAPEPPAKKHGPRRKRPGPKTS